MMGMSKDCYAGTLLRVDLTSGTITKEPLGPEVTDLHLGGRGLASKILFDEVPPEIGPFEPGNRLIFAPGALMGTPTPAASRTTVTARSPLTAMHGDGHSGAGWGGELKPRAMMRWSSRARPKGPSTW